MRKEIIELMMISYHPCKRLWRLMVYSLVTTSSFLPLLALSTGIVFLFSLVWRLARPLKQNPKFYLSLSRTYTILLTHYVKGISFIYYYFSAPLQPVWEAQHKMGLKSPNDNTQSFYLVFTFQGFRAARLLLLAKRVKRFFWFDYKEGEKG